MLPSTEAQLRAATRRRTDWHSPPPTFTALDIWAAEERRARFHAACRHHTKWSFICVVALGALWGVTWAIESIGGVQ